MSYKCDYCEKGVQYGETSNHHRGVAGGRWKKKAQSTRKVFKPNLHVTRVKVGVESFRVRLCTKCLRKVKAVSIAPVASA